MILERAAERSGDLARRRPGLVAIAVLVVLAAATALWPRFEIESDIASLFAQDDPVLQLVAALPSRGASARDLFVVVRGDDVRTRIPAIVRALEASPHVESVHATPESVFGELGAAQRSAPLAFVAPELIDRLDARLTPAGRQAAIAELRAKLASDPVGGRELAVRDPLGLRWILDDAARGVSPLELARGTPYAVLADGRTALIRVHGLLPSLDVAFSRALLADLEDRLAHDDVTFLGGYAIARAQAAQMRADLEWSTIVSVLLVACYLSWTLRGLLRPLLVLLPVGVGVYCALPVGAALVGPLTPIAISASAILIGLGVDFSIHWVTAWDARRRERADESIADAVRAIQREMARPLCAGFVTTAAAFLSLGLVGFPGLFGFAVLLVLGLGIAVAATFVLSPWLVSHARFAARPAPRTLLGPLRDALVSRPGAERTAKFAVSISVVAILVALVLSPPTVAADPDALRPDDDAHAAARADLGREVGFDLAPRFVLWPADADLDAVAAAFDRLRAAGTTVFDVGPHRAIATDARATRLAKFRTEHIDLVTATLADLRAAGFAPEPFRPGLEEFAALLLAPPPTVPPDATTFADGVPRRVTTLWVPPDAPPETEPLARALTDAGAPRPDRVLGPRSVADHLGARLAEALRAGLVWAGALCSLVVLVALGRRGLTALVPVLLSVPALLAMLGLLGIPIHQATFVALPFLVGLGLDDGIHILARHRAGGACPPGITGDAIERTSLTSILGFGSLATAASPGLAALGLMLGVGAFLCLVTSLFALPPLLGRVADRAPARLAPSGPVP